MTRAAAVAGWLLAVVTLVRDGLHPGGGLWETACLVAAAGALAAGWLTWRRRAGGQVILVVLAFFLCVRYLSIYFHSSKMWPTLAIILLGSITLGLALLGLLLDRFRPPPPKAG